MSLGNAIGYLTAARVQARRRVPLVYSLHYFPWIGAAIASLTVLCFLLANRVLPNVLASLLAVALPQALAGWDPWRGLAEAVQGRRTHPGHGFHAGFRPNARGWGVLAAVILVKWAALWSLPLDWQMRAVLLFPILGICARTAAFLLPPAKAALRSPLLARSRVRAGFLTGFLLFLVFLFPVRVAIPLLASTAALVWAGVRAQNRRTHGLTLQTASCASELAEVWVLVALALAARFFAG